jgi:hypothetical protein
VQQLFRRLSGVFQGMPRGLEDHAPPRVHAGGFGVVEGVQA